MPQELHDEPSPRGQGPESTKRKDFSRFAWGLVLGLGLGLGGGFLWMMQWQDARFVAFQIQTKMHNDLRVADLEAAHGRADEARTSYQRLLDLEPQWTDALERYAWFLHSQSEQSLGSGELTKALADARECQTIAQRFYALDKAKPSAQRILKSAHDQMADVLERLGVESNAVQVFQLRQHSLALAEPLYLVDPHSTQLARDLHASLCRIGDILARRGEPGDAESALKHFTRALEIAEKLLVVNPASAQRVHDVSITLEKLGALRLNRFGPGDAEAALTHFSRKLEIAEKLRAANPDSVPIALDVVVSHDRLAAYCLKIDDKVGEEKHSRACYDLLHKRIVEGATFDPPIVSLHDQLHARFGK